MYPCEYFVNPDKGVVVCKLYDTDEALLDDMERHNLAPAHEQAYITTLINEFYVGKAVCQPGDKFNAEIGKRIAYKKAVRKLTIAKKKGMKRVLESAYKGYQWVADAAAKLNVQYDKVIGSCTEQIIRIADGKSDIKKEGEK